MDLSVKIYFTVEILDKIILMIPKEKIDIMSII